VLYHLAANGVMLIHFAFIVFAIFGSLLVALWPRLLWAHLPCLAWASWIALTGSLCPLTPLENHFRQLAGAQGYDGGFIEHYIAPAIYPEGLTRELQIVMAGILIGTNAAGYGLLLLRRRRARAAPASKSSASR
jgi:hypothetical protein